MRERSSDNGEDSEVTRGRIEKSTEVSLLSTLDEKQLNVGTSVIEKITETCYHHYVRSSKYFGIKFVCSQTPLPRRYCLQTPNMDEAHNRMLLLDGGCQSIEQGRSHNSRVYDTNTTDGRTVTPTRCCKKIYLKTLMQLKVNNDLDSERNCNFSFYPSLPHLKQKKWVPVSAPGYSSPPSVGAKPAELLE
ncbi:hypothetical protein JEQ12_002287 [Ovis aries]|uniref:Uncharacterized protein n=1 Tax=Ovis aries TaxID=9940 RepID=A0A836A6I0_SHEEP|nr:hypothetical protein JEQ12_002287 [Ovis aries]